MDKPEQVGMSQERLARIAPAIEQHLGEGKIAGAVTLLWRRGALVHLESHGLMDRENNVPMRSDAICRIFSMTKPITIAALMTLFERGLVRLTDPASRYIPAFDDLKVYDGEEGSEIKVTDLERPVTIWNLVTHTSGLTYHFPEPGPVEQLYREAKVSSQKPLDKFIDDLAKLPLAFQPGASWRYGFGHDVIARIVEIVGGKPFGEYLSSTILDPLGMEDTGFYVPDEKRGRYSSEYGYADVLEPDMTATRLAGDGGRLKIKLLRTANQGLEAKPHAIFRGGHGLVSTAEDYLQFCLMLLRGGELNGARILGRKTVELMHANQLTDALLPDDMRDQGLGFGFGVRVLMDLGQSQNLGTEGEYGWGGAAGTYYWIDPREDFIGVYMKQLQGGDFPDVADFRTTAYQAIVD